MMTTESKQPLPLTEAGRARLREELDRLVREREPELMLRLREARERSSAEDIESYPLLDELARVRQRIAELERALAAAVQDTPVQPPGTITIGSRVVARDEKGRVHTFVLVSPVEADAARGHISIASPVGAALLGRQAGDRTSVAVPTGQRAFEIVEVT
jgi:transcription elongation GreA/GreB family factor